MNKFQTGKRLLKRNIKKFHAQQRHLFMLLRQRPLRVQQKYGMNKKIHEKRTQRRTVKSFKHKNKEANPGEK